MLISAPCLTKNLTISIESDSIATLKGHLLISREFQKAMINLKRNIMLLSNDKYEKKKNDVKQ